ncbi:MAG: peptidoglycan-associated lipoprotein Pal [Rhizobacter sp.]|nr:peptidoglycan-associated lipoprotein Pal [Rhizobacter sp.]
MSRLALIAAVSSAFLAGCASNVKLDDKPAPVESRTPSTSGAGGSGASSSGTSPNNVASVDLTKSASATELSKVVYFDYDSFVVKDEFRPVVEAQAKMLSTDRNKKLSVEGHTDERGGSEYNLALGQKRAESVAKALKLLGVNDGQVEAVSFGKERPAAQGSDEAVWAKNRRAELNNR